MKKKRLRLVTTIAILAALFGSGGGTAWGQRYVLNNNGTTNVNNQFGAGESSKLSPGTNGARSVISPWNIKCLVTQQMEVRLRPIHLSVEHIALRR